MSIEERVVLGCVPWAPRAEEMPSIFERARLAQGAYIMARSAYAHSELTDS